MPLIVEPGGYSRESLLALLRETREGLDETLGNLDAWPHAVIDPLSFRTARDLLVDARALGEDLGAQASQDRLARVINVQYDVVLAAIDLMKSHSAVPSRVPRPSTTSADQTGRHP
jgi:hypothetical protein